MKGQGPKTGAGGWSGARLLGYVGIALLGVLFLLGLVNLVAPRGLSGELADQEEPTPLRADAVAGAAIIDQTGMSFPSDAFIADATALLEGAGYEVTYHPPQEVSVAFYRSLPSKGYDFLLFQSHATSEVVTRGGGESGASPGPFLFTTEPYGKHRHLALQMSDQVRASQLFYEDSPELFAVGPGFVERSMHGFFDGSVVLIGGCQALAAEGLARAFLARGASAVVGWDGMVNLAHNNEAMLYLMEEMLVHGRAASEAVRATMGEVGPDPQFDSRLKVVE